LSGTTAVGWTQRVEDIALGLLTLEVNTISKMGMSAEKLPTLPIALHSIVEDYAEYLGNRLHPYTITQQLMSLARARLSITADGAANARAALMTWSPSDPDATRADLTNGPETFEALRWAAQSALRDDDNSRVKPGANPLFSGEERAVLDRIVSNSRQLRQAVLALQASASEANKGLYGVTLEATSNALITAPRLVIAPANINILVRKAWEIGTETVLFQSVIQVDGDVVTRLSPSMGEAQRALLTELHRNSVQTSLSQWQSLFNLVCSLASQAAAMLFGTSR
jgi:hypothetical protein